MYQQVTRQEYGLIAAAITYRALADIAVAQAVRMLGQAWQVRGTDFKLGVVCGPISTGGHGSFEQNFAYFKRAVLAKVADNDGFFFSQLPFERAIWRIKAVDVQAVGKVQADRILLLEFYRRLFASRCIGQMHFLPRWPSSSGSTWERQYGCMSQFDLYELDEQFRSTPAIF